jgi:hypothetical protein
LQEVLGNDYNEEAWMPVIADVMAAEKDNKTAVWAVKRHIPLSLRAINPNTSFIMPKPTPLSRFPTPCQLKPQEDHLVNPYHLKGTRSFVRRIVNN